MSKQNYTQRDDCRSCGGSDLQSVYAVPPIPVAGIYYQADDEPVNILAPMILVLCSTCGLVQLRETINSAFYRDYNFVGNSALTYQKHLEMVAKTLVEEWGVRNKKVFEVGASNGVFLSLLAAVGQNDVAGIEPSAKLCEDAASRGVAVGQGYFNREYLTHNNPGIFDCVVIRHVLEHIDELNGMIASIRAILSENGLLVVEIPDWEAIMRRNLLSNVFHEHLNYFSLGSMNALLQRHGLAVIQRRTVDIHGGSLLLFCRHAKNVVSARIPANSLQFDSFAARARIYYTAIHELVLDRINQGKTVHGFGASHRTFILLGNSGIGCAEVPVIYDSNPFLHNRRLNGFHSIVRAKEAIMADAPDVLLIFATSYDKEVTSFLIKDCGYRGEIISLRYEKILSSSG